MSLPTWYPIRKLNKQVNIEKLRELGQKRINLLVSLARGEKNVENNNLLQDELANTASFLALAITASLSGDPIFINWFKESEGDLLSVLIRRANSYEKVSIIKDVFVDVEFGWKAVHKLTRLNMDEVIRELSYLLADMKLKPSFFIKLQQNELSIVCVKFWRAPKTLGRKRGILRNGWLVVPLDILSLELKSAFQKKIENEIIPRIKQHGNDLKELADSLLDYWKKKRSGMIVRRIPELPIVSGKKLYEREDLWPPCMRILIAKLRATGYLQHNERLQLGLFLKKLGMSLDEQLQFWYKIAVDNVGMSWEEFEKKGGYYIKHIYGVVGSRKDYEAPKCDTIIAKYFCPFKHLASEELKEYLMKIYGLQAKVVREIISIAHRDDPKKACSQLISIVLNKKIEKEIRHPLQYVKIMFYSSRKKGDKDIRRTASNAKQSQDGGHKSKDITK